MNGKIIAAALLATGAAALYARSRNQTGAPDAPDFSGIGDEFGALFNGATQEAAELVDTITGGALKLSAMAQVTAAHMGNPNVQAFLRVIRRGEGTTDDAGYRRVFGGQLFTGYADHPRIRIYEKADEFIRNGKKDFTTAAGAYQFTATTWDETRRIMSLPDFSPPSQDWGAVGRIAARGALEDVIAGRLAVAIKKCAVEWASLPGSPWGQPVISMATAASVYAANGGMVTV